MTMPVAITKLGSAITRGALRHFARHGFGLAACALLGISSSAHAVNFWVGSAAGGCNYATIAAALHDAAMAVGTRNIYIASNQAYSSQAISITGLDVHFIGGVPDCMHLSPSGSTTISGGAGTSVFTIRGASHVSFSHLTISDGNDGTGSSGGGIDFAGTGSVNVDHTLLLNNQAGYGGGINFNGSGGVADLYINTQTQILYNTATTSGGGIRMEGNSWLHVLAPDTLIAFNTAVGGYGGGIEMIGPAQGDIGSPGTSFSGNQVGVLYQNSAQYGGGISINGGDGDGQTAIVRMFATDPKLPARIEDNSAAHTGGGVYLQSNAGSNPSGAALCGTGYRIDANKAQEGSAIYLDEDYSTIHGYSGSTALLYDSAIDNNACAGDPPASLGKVTCTSDTCNSIDGNLAQTNAGVATAGSAVLVQTTSYFTADRIRMRANQGGHVLRIAGGGGALDFTEAALYNGLITGNTSSSDLLLADTDPTFLDVWNCTIANNTITSGNVVHATDRLHLEDSIIAQGPLATLNYGGDLSHLFIDYVMSLEIASLSHGTHLMQADPSFVDAGHGDFHLLPASLAIDFAPSAPAGSDPTPDLDLDQRVRNVDIFANPNRYGVRDLGAYEHPLSYCDKADTVFCSGFDFD